MKRFASIIAVAALAFCFLVGCDDNRSKDTGTPLKASPEVKSKKGNLAADELPPPPVRAK